MPSYQVFILGDAVCKNLVRNGFNVTAMYDINLEKCKGYPADIEIKSSPREVAEASDIIVTGIVYTFI